MKAKKARATIFVMVLASLAFFTLSGFDYSIHSIPLDEISDGGAGNDGIPSIDNPHFLTVVEADQSLMQNEDRVLGFVRNDQAPEIEQKVLDYSLEFSTLVQKRVSNEFKKQGIQISDGGVHIIWPRHNLQIASLRLKQLAKWSAENEGTLTESQV